jgi:CheY-like chemotaxis protein
MRNLLEQILAPAGFELCWAEDGVAAVEIFQRTEPEFVLMDLRMPHMDGFEATRKIRSCEGSHRPTIIGVSGSAFVEDRERALQSGCDEFVAKPFHVDELFAVLARYQGVRFVEWVGTASDAFDNVPPSSQALRNFPPEWWTALDDATALGDIARIRGLADEIHARAPGLAARLRALASRFDLRGIDDLIHKGSGQWITQAIPK